MSNIFIFEDREGTPSSQLLLASHCKNIKFSEGFSNIKCLLDDKQKSSKSIYNANDEYFVFIDAVPDNKDLVIALDKLQVEMRDKANVHIIPILCVEYYITRLLYDMKLLSEDRDTQLGRFVEYLVADFRWSEFITAYGRYVDGKLWIEEGKRVYVHKTLEKAYKYILKIGNDCTNNAKANEKHPNRGIFYTTDCNTCGLCDLCDKSQLYKAERLFTSLPVYSAYSEEQKDFWIGNGMKFESATLEQIKDRCNELYRKIYEDLGEEQKIFMFI